MQIKIIVIDPELSPRARRHLLAVAALGTIVTLAAVAYAEVPNSFTANQPISASAMNENFAALDARLSAIESQVPKSQPPAGTVVAFAGPVVPIGWLACDGRALSRTEFPELFSAIGTVHGAGDGASTFQLPDLRGRVVAGEDDMGGDQASRLTTADAGFAGDILGSFGGSQHLVGHSHAAGVLVADLSGEHSHGVDNTSVEHAQGGRQFNWTTGTRHTTTHVSAFAGEHTHTVSGETARAGEGDGHGNVQPTLVLQYIIRV